VSSARDCHPEGRDPPWLGDTRKCGWNKARPASAGAPLRLSRISPFSPAPRVLYFGLIAPVVRYGRKRFALVRFASAKGAPASFVAGGLRQKAAIGAVDTMEETMMLWTIGELMHLTRDELCNLAAMIEQSLPWFDAGTGERHDALTSLGNIRHVMIRRGLHY
jgi:hypothetical protein